MNCTNCPSPITCGVTLASTCGGTSFLIFMGILETFLRKQCDLEDPCNRIIQPKKLNSSYDFIVIGAGSAGSVVASRLSEEQGYSVLLLEAGLDEPAWLHVPSFLFNALGTNLDWQYNYQGDECSNENGAKCYWPRGKVLGGTSTINALMYVRGAQKDFNDWEAMGNRGWSFRDVLPFFKKSENNQQINVMDSGYHSQGGPLPVTNFNYQPPFVFDVLKAGKELGYNTVDSNGNSHTGFQSVQSTTNRGSRYSTARAFLRPARNRQNLHILLNATATRIIFNDNKTAVAVEFHKNGELIKVGVDKEVIISGGIVNSPQILMNSGIGPREHLESMGVPLIHHLPGVGENLHDQVNIPLIFSINDTDKNELNWASAMKYLLYRTGPLSATGIAQVVGFINSKYANPENDHPDIQFAFGGYFAICSENGMIDNNSNSRKIVIAPIVVRPKSKGFLKLRNSDPLSIPLFYPQYLSDPHDVDVLIEGIKFVLRFIETDAMRKYNLQLDRTLMKGCQHLEFGSDPYWECVIRSNKGPGNHQAGSCKMGPNSDAMAVVDHQLRVKGIQRVRVADASIMPQVTSGNPNAPIIMIGERAADFIKSGWRL